MKVKIKFNYFFFLFAIIIPLIVGTIGMLIYWPAIHSHYWTVFMTPTENIMIGYVIVFAFVWFIVSYMAMPWLVVIKKDKIVFHRLFRRKLVVEIDKIRRIEFMTKRLPVEEHRWYIGNIMFYEKDGGRIFVGDVPHSAYMVMREILNSKGVEVIETQRKITKEENEEMINKRIIKW